MPDSKQLSQLVSYEQSKIYGYAKYVTTENKTEYVSREINIDNIKDRYLDIKYVGMVIICEDVFLK